MQKTGLQVTIFSCFYRSIDFLYFPLSRYNLFTYVQNKSCLSTVSVIQFYFILNNGRKSYRRFLCKNVLIITTQVWFHKNHIRDISLRNWPFPIQKNVQIGELHLFENLFSLLWSVSFCFYVIFVEHGHSSYLWLIRSDDS